MGMGQGASESDHGFVVHVIASMKTNSLLNREFVWMTELISNGINSFEEVS